MKLFVRMIPMALRGLMQPALDPTEPLTSRFRVLPLDIDINLHLNNGRYLQLLDVNRLEWLMRTRILNLALTKRWKPILGSTAIQFRREMKLFDVGVMRTQLLGWDERWFFLEHRVDTPSGKPVALALAKAAFRGKGKWISSLELRDALAADVPDLCVPAHVTAMLGLDAHLGKRLEQQD